ncbi:MAG: ABC transporter permease subunit [Acidimicrobiales bacterium]
MSSVTTLDIPAGHYQTMEVVRGEIVKILTLRSTIVTLIVTFVGGVGISILSTNSAGHHNQQWYQGFDPTNNSLAGLLVAVLTIGVFGALAVTGEYSSGTIRSSLAASPRRSTFLLAKLLVIGVMSLVVSELLSFACFGIGQAILSSGGAPTASLGQPGVLRAVVCSGLILGMLGLAGAAVGLVIRNTAGTIATYAGLMLVMPIILNRISVNASQYTPVQILANSVAAVIPQQNAVSAPFGILLIALYLSAVLGLAATLFSRRDA